MDHQGRSRIPLRPEPENVSPQDVTGYAKRLDQYIDRDSKLQQQEASKVEKRVSSIKAQLDQLRAEKKEMVQQIGMMQQLTSATRECMEKTEQRATEKLKLVSDQVEQSRKTMEQKKKELVDQQEARLSELRANLIDMVGTNTKDETVDLIRREKLDNLQHENEQLRSKIEQKRKILQLQLDNLKRKHQLELLGGLKDTGGLTDATNKVSAKRQKLKTVQGEIDQTCNQIKDEQARAIRLKVRLAHLATFKGDLIEKRDAMVARQAKLHTEMARFKLEDDTSVKQAHEDAKTEYEAAKTKVAFIQDQIDRLQE